MIFLLNKILKICVHLRPKELFQYQCPSQQVMNAADFAIYSMMLHDLREVGLADGADGRQVISSR